MAAQDLRETPRPCLPCALFTGASISPVASPALGLRTAVRPPRCFLKPLLPTWPPLGRPSLSEPRLCAPQPDTGSPCRDVPSVRGQLDRCAPAERLPGAQSAAARPPELRDSAARPPVRGAGGPGPRGLLNDLPMEAGFRARPEVVPEHGGVVSRVCPLRVCLALHDGGNSNGRAVRTPGASCDTLQPQLPVPGAQTLLFLNAFF